MSPQAPQASPHPPTQGCMDFKWVGRGTGWLERRLSPVTPAQYPCTVPKTLPRATRAKASTPQAAQHSTAARSAITPAAWPARGGRPRALAQRVLPSMII